MISTVGGEGDREGGRSYGEGRRREKLLEKGEGEISYGKREKIGEVIGEGGRSYGTVEE